LTSTFARLCGICHVYFLNRNRTAFAKLRDTEFCKASDYNVFSGSEQLGANSNLKPEPIFIANRATIRFPRRFFAAALLANIKAFAADCTPCSAAIIAPHESA
jgi:hypothetical protein